MGKYNDSTPFGTLLADPEAMAVLTKHAPNLANHPMLELAKTMPYGTVLSMAGGQLSPEQLASVKADIAEL